jgi:hypothetical protein
VKEFAGCENSQIGLETRGRMPQRGTGDQCLLNKVFFSVSARLD